MCRFVMFLFVFFGAAEEAKAEAGGIPLSFADAFRECSSVSNAKKASEEAGNTGLLRGLRVSKTRGFSLPRATYLNRDTVRNRTAQREETRDTTVIWVLMEGPAVSLKGSPTVSPTTAA